MKALKESVLLGVGAAVLLGLIPPVLAELSVPATQSKTASSNGPITIGQAIKIAEQAVGGDTTAAVLTQRDGHTFFEVDVAEGGNHRAVLVDPESGHFLLIDGSKSSAAGAR